MKNNLLPSLLFTTFSLCLLIVNPSLIKAAIPEHQDITAWQGTTTCLQCHESEGKDVFHSVHYQWLGSTPYMIDGPVTQGKLDMAVNSYCINITGNWDGCSSCHTGLGARPEPTASLQQLQNIDCLICHQESYSRKRVGGDFVPDTDKMTISMVEAAQTVHLPTRSTCLQCHAKGGGGDNFKRGDLALAHGTTSDKNFDVHMATTGGNLQCRACHTVEKHRFAGRGSDIRPTDLDVEIDCTDCHDGKDSSGGHDRAAVDTHVNRVACQTCHIPTYARNAIDTKASEETEIHRNWLRPHETTSGAIHPTPTMAGNVIPRYRWWNGTSTSYLLFDNAVVDPETGKIPTSRPVGNITTAGAKLYPFKYKTANQPLVEKYNQLIALDTSIYFSSGDTNAAVMSGLANMGYNQNESYSWIETDTFQLITHEVAPASKALSCNSCHTNTSRMDLMALGYHLKAPKSTLCIQCHDIEDQEEGPIYIWIHNQHVQEEGYDCGWCHAFSRPERDLRLPPAPEQKPPSTRRPGVVGGLTAVLKILLLNNN